MKLAERIQIFIGKLFMYSSGLYAAMKIGDATYGFVIGVGMALFVNLLEIHRGQREQGK